MDTAPCEVNKSMYYVYKDTALFTINTPRPDVLVFVSTLQMITIPTFLPIFTQNEKHKQHNAGIRVSFETVLERIDFAFSR